MGREVRKLPKGYEHLKDQDGRYVPQHDESYSAALHEWWQGRQKWESGYVYDWDLKCWVVELEKTAKYTWEEWTDCAPDPKHYMWYGQPPPASERTMYVMYENTSEGTPISPAFETEEELARWLADNRASIFGSQTGSYEDWMDRM